MIDLKTKNQRIKCEKVYVIEESVSVSIKEKN